MKLFSMFSRQTPEQSACPAWRKRDDALAWGVPMVLLPALAFIPVAASLIVEPAFAHARVMGFLLLPVVVTVIAQGISKLALCLNHEFDVLSLFAGGTAIVLVVISMCAGVVLASTIAG